MHDEEAILLTEMAESATASPEFTSDLDAISDTNVSIDCLNKKRKLPSGDQLPADDSSNLCIKKVKCSRSIIGDESNPIPSEDSCIFNGDAFTYFPEGTKICVSCPKSSASIQSCTTSVDYDGASSEISPYFLETQSVKKPCSRKSESLSACEEVDCYGLLPCPMYGEHILEFGSCANCSCMDCQNDGLEHFTNKEPDDMLYSGGVMSSNYVLSSGRWPVDQDSKQNTQKLTIDKEFEQYFSMLML